MIRSLSTSVMCLAVLAIIFPASALLAKDPDFLFIELEKVSRYTEDRLAYIQVQKMVNPEKDDSRAALLIIRKSIMYLIQDGYDDHRDVLNLRNKLVIDNQDFRDEDLWVSKITGKPNYIRVTDRRVELMKNFDQEYVSKNFGAQYTKERDAFVGRHVTIFNQLMSNRKESGLTVVRDPLPGPAYLNAPKEETAKIKYYMSVTAKSNDGRVYFAEDADGDGVAETFSVSIPDNFHWGYRSGPNVIFIYKNKEKAIADIIGKLTNNSYYGTPAEEKRIIETFPKDDQIIDELVNSIRDEPK
jgi:hypothetical protein